jgi:hypothetical protein
MRIQKFLIIATLSLIIYGCTNSEGLNSTSPVSSPTSSSELQHGSAAQSTASPQMRKPCIPIEEPRTENVFDPTKLQIGSRFMGLKVTKMDATCKTNGYDGMYLGTATFQGKIIISGIYNPRYEIEGGEDVCFNVAQQDDLKLPRMWGEQRVPWFCFDNPARAKQLLGTEKALQIQIVIDNFTIVHEPKGVYNRATLVGVIDKVTIKP